MRVQRSTELQAFYRSGAVQRKRLQLGALNAEAHRGTRVQTPAAIAPDMAAGALWDYPRQSRV